MLFSSIILISLFTFLLILKQGKNKEDKYIILWYLCFNLQIIGYYLKSLLLINGITIIFIYLRIPILLCYPPIFFIYHNSIKEQKIGIKKILLLFSPAALLASYYIVLFIINNFNYMSSLVMSSLNYDDPVYIVSRVYFFISFIVLFIISKPKLTIKKWSGLFSIAALVLFICSLLFGIGFNVNLLYLCIAIIMSVLTVLGFREPTIIFNLEELDVNNSSNKVKVKLKEIKLIEKKLNDAIYNNKVYTDVNLTFELLSTKTGIPQYLLTYLLNKIKKKSFSDYINELRLDEFISLYRNNNANNNILELAKLAGFPSKPTFYRVFKKKYNCSPSEYLK